MILKFYAAGFDEIKLLSSAGRYAVYPQWHTKSRVRHILP